MQLTALPDEPEALYRFMFDYSPVPMVMSKVADGTILNANQAFADSMGASLESLLGRRLTDFYADRDERPRLLKALREQGRHSKAEVQIRDCNSNLRWIVMDARVVERNGEEVVFGGWTDITSIKHAEASLRAGEERYREMIENQGEGIIIVDLNEAMLYANPAADEIFGVIRGTLIGRLLSEFTSDTQKQILLSQTERRKKGEKSSYEIEIQRPSGEIRHVLVTATPRQNKMGQIVGTFGVFRDITDRRRMEGELHSSELRYRSLFENMPAGYAYCKMLYDERHQPVDWIYLAVNPPFEQITGLKDIVGKRVTEAIPGIRESSPEAFEVYGRVAATGQPERFEIDFKPLNLELDISVFSPAQGHFVAIFEDITQRKRAAKRLARLNEAFISFGTDPIANINRLTALTGEFTGATCAVYNRLQDEMLCAVGRWHTPPDFDPLSKPEGRICHEVIKGRAGDVHLIRDLMNTDYAQTDPNVSRYGLQTYVGVPVTCAEEIVGSLCVVFQRDYEPTEGDKNVLGIIAAAVGVEEARRRENSALRESEERYRLLADHSGDVIWRLNLDTLRFTYMSPSAVALTGFRPEEILAKSLEDIMTPESYRLIAEEIPRRMADFLSGDPSARVRTYEIDLLGKDGTAVPVEVVTTMVKDETNGALHVVGSSRNIAERKRALEALQNSEQMLSSIFSSVSVVLFSLSVEAEERFRFLSVNQPFLNATGLNETAVVGKYVEDVIPEPSLTLVLEKYREALRNKATVRWEEVTDYPAGRRFGDAAATPILDADGRCTMLIGSVHDVTERKQTEEALRESEERFQQVAESAGEWIWEVNAEGLYTYVSPIVEKILGYTPDDLVGKMHFYDLFAPDVREELKAGASAAFAQRLSIVGFVNPNVHKNGNIVILETNGLPIVDEHGNFQGYRGADLDITVRTQAEKNLQEDARELADSKSVLVQVLESIPVRVFWKDRDSKYLGCNTLFAQDAGLDRPEELLARTDYELGWKDQADQYRADDQEVMRLGRSKLNIVEPQTTPDGTAIWLKTSKVPLRSSDGDVWGVLGLYEDITERKQAEEALRLERDKLENVTRNIGAGLAIISRDYQTLWANNVLKEIFGDVEGKTCHLTFNQQCEVCRGCGVREIFEDGKDVVVHEQQGKNALGEIVWSQIVTTPVKDTAGNVTAALELVVPITERKRAEEALRRQNDHLTALQETTLDLISRLDLNDLLANIVKRAGQLVGTTAGWLDFLDDPGAGHLTPKVALGALAEESPKYSVRPGEGISGTVWQTGQPMIVDDYDTWPGRVQDHARNLIKSIVAVPLISGSDVIGVLGLAYERGVDRTFDDEAVKSLCEFARLATIAIENARLFSAACEELAERTRAEGNLRTSKAHLSNALRIGKLGHWEYDFVKDVFTFSDEFYALFRTTAEQVGGYTMPSARYAELFVHPDDLSYVSDGIRKSVETTDPNFSLQLEHRIIYADKTVGYIAVRFQIVKDQEGRTIRSYGVNQDITERKHAEEEKKQLESQLRQAQKLETIGTLAGGIAHDFNNILTPILAYSQMAAMVLEQEHPVRANIEQVVSSANRAKDLVKQILTFSRQSEQQRFPMDPTPIVKEALKLMRASIPTTIEIAQNIDSKCGPILADPSQIHQVLMNLCTNAYHAMRDSGGTLTVALQRCSVDGALAKTLHDLLPGEYVRLTVADTGCGMDQQTLERIFEPFFTTKEVGEGTGLGLSVVHGIIAKHEGAVAVRSAPGKGTTFDVYFPCATSVTQRPLQDDSPVTGGHERILVVDDELVVAEATRSILEKFGYAATIRTSSLEALELFRQDPQRFDLVITDQTMPQLPGDHLAKELIALRMDIPIILMTGFSQNMDEERCRKLGIDRFLMKPLLPVDLARAVRSVLDGVIADS